MKPLVLSIACLLLVACGASSREKTIATTFAVVHAADTAFVQYDQAHRTQIVTNATSHDAGQAALNAWDATATKVETDIVAAYKAVAAAAALNDDPSFAGMAQAALIIKTELETLGVLK